jgi:hypothetical protein
LQERKKGIWPLAKLAKTPSHLLPTPPSIPNLVTPSRHATTPFEKAEALKTQVSPPLPDTDFSNIPNTLYSAEML